MAIGGISSALGYSVYGIGRAVSRFESAANNVVRAGAEASSGQESTDSTSFSPAALDRARNGLGPEASLERGLVDSGLAADDLTANVRVAQTADEMTATLLNMGAQKTSG